MNADERRQKLDLYGKAYDLLTEAIKEFPVEMWQFRAGPDGWTIHEIIVHITDSEANSFIRCRRAIAEPGSAVLDYDEAGWAQRLHYHEQSTDDAIQLFRYLRQNSYKLVKDLPESMWANTIEHSANGTMTLDDWLNTYTSHVPDHVAQMREVYKAWQAQVQQKQ
jgi:hypothetical protein